MIKTIVDHILYNNKKVWANKQKQFKCNKRGNNMLKKIWFEICWTIFVEWL